MSFEGGYRDDKSMSNRAHNAYSQGLKPLSKIVASDLPTGWSLKLARAAAKAGLWPRSEWHHSSKFYNEVDFYDPETLADVDLQEIKDSMQQAKSNNKHKVIGYFGEWSGRGRSKTLHKIAFRGTLTGDWITQISKWNGTKWTKSPIKKRTNGNWIAFAIVPVPKEFVKNHSGNFGLDDFDKIPAPRGFNSKFRKAYLRIQ